ncbi:STAS domain-containing protein [Amycolatopsis sp. NPDC051071]|uniref:STAS domain-containing protein n=1 Tax=Amycolatopsis sp. NPDC051071 TaxID=3154637 RepID=UPI0034179BBB
MLTIAASSLSRPTEQHVRCAGITVTTTADATVVAASGELDLTVTTRFQYLLADAVRHRPASLIVDLSGVTFISSRGLAVLLDNVTAAHAQGIPCAVIATHHCVLRPIRVLRLDRVMPVHTEHSAAEVSLPRQRSPESPDTARDDGLAPQV